MIDSITGGRLIAGFAVGGGPEAYNYQVSSPQSRGRFWEGRGPRPARMDRGRAAPFEHEGRHYPLRYVNIWPKAAAVAAPAGLDPGRALSVETIHEVAKRGFDFFLSSRTHGSATRMARERFAAVLAEHGDRYQPFRFGVLISVYVAETDEQAREEAREGVWYFLKYCLKGHLRRTGRTLTFGPGVPVAVRQVLGELPEEFRARRGNARRRGLVGRARFEGLDHRRQPPTRCAASSGT